MTSTTTTRRPAIIRLTNGRRYGATSAHFASGMLHGEGLQLLVTVGDYEERRAVEDRSWATRLVEQITWTTTAPC